MSLNLVWYFPKREIGVKYEDFFIQTPTSLTKEVFEKKNNDKKIKLIEQYLINKKWERKLYIKQLKEMKYYLDNGIELRLI